jgi:hypothetical protein
LVEHLEEEADMTDEQLALKREAAIKAFNEAKVAKRAAAEAAKPKAVVLPFPEDAQARRRIALARPGRWTWIPDDRTMRRL